MNDSIEHAERIDGVPAPVESEERPIGEHGDARSTAQPRSPARREIGVEVGEIIDQVAATELRLPTRGHDVDRIPVEAMQGDVVTPPERLEQPAHTRNGLDDHRMWRERS